jgi:hypothetical protein
MKLRLPIAALIVLIFVAAFNYLGTHFHLYYIFTLYDVPMHFLGGVWVGLMALWVLQVFFSKIPHTFIRTFIWVLSVTLFTAVVWEMFEFYSGLTFTHMLTPAGLTYWADTTKDICMGLLGGSVAFIFGYKKS